MSEKSPPPPSPTPVQLQDLQEAKTLLRKAGWTIDGPNGTHDILSKIIESAKSNMGTIVGATSASKKREWEKVRAAGLVLKEQFTSLWEDEMVARVANAVVGKIELRVGTGGTPPLESIGVVEKVVEALDRRFESKLESLVGKATSFQFSDDSAAMQIISERIQDGLKDPIYRMMQEVNVSWKAAEEVTDRCERMMKDAREKIGEMGGKMDKLVNDVVGIEGAKNQAYENWDMVNGDLGSVVNSHGELQLNFAAALQAGAAKKAEKVASEAAGNVLRAPHAQAIREAKANSRKVVIRPSGQLSELGWLESMSERELVAAANTALGEIGVAGARNGPAEVMFVSARC
ncbi:hypothetical protein GGU10DRAFT_381568 [Lentinula aff. detonsa]|uniref:Uncharacterized protein n=1 Tax=Lentinula aff. detonsa TaxID=2804958 RepID=A0AA38KSY8_9AGAR|nr:hypothetical protein GGU10DRAFT_381568 [Lentinula aff. detonsa]